jgi:predicted RND superfamily exporter protein
MWAKRMSQAEAPVDDPSYELVSSGSRRLAGWLVRWRLPLALVAAVATIAAVNQARQLGFSQSIETMFDRTDPALPPYHRLARTFGSSEVVLAVYDDAELFTSAGIERLQGIASNLAGVPGVASVMSLADTPLGNRIIQVDSMPMAGRAVSLMEGYVVGADRRTAGIACVLASSENGSSDRVASRDLAIDQIRVVMAEMPQGTVAGEPVMLRDGFAMLRRDGNLLGIAAGLLAGGVILLLFRSLRWVVVPLAVVLMALWGTRGVLAATGVKLTMVSTMLSAMITVVGIATVTHMIVEFRRQREGGREPVAAMQQTLARLLWPVAGAIATDMIGFGSLIASRVGPVHDFGVMTSLGAGLVLVAVVLAVPFLALAGRFDTDPRRVVGEGGLERALDQLVQRIVAKPRAILGMTGLVVAVAVAGMSRLTVETDFTKNFRDDSPIVAAYDVVESKLGGAGVWDVLVPVGDGITGDTLLRLSRFEQRLREIEIEGPSGPEPALTKVLSLVDVIDAVSPIPSGQLGVSSAGRWLLEQAIGGLRSQLPQLAAALIGEDPQDGSVWLRVMLRARERQPAEAKRAVIEQVRSLAAESFPEDSSGRAAEVTGFFVLLAQLVERMITDQWYTFGLAAAGIFTMLSLAFRSPLLAALALVPNALPIFLVLGILGWAGQPINMGTAMIAAVSMGLSVDSSIHYVTAFRRRRDAGHSVEAALGVAHQTAGRAIVFSTLALVVGFLALCTSGFMPTVSFGALSCLTLAGGLVGNLVVLPVLLSLVGDPQYGGETDRGADSPGHSG